MEPSDVTPPLEAHWASILAVYRANGSILTSPVWYRAVEDWVELVIADGDAKLDRLRADPRCVFMAFEMFAPFRGFRIETDATLTDDGVGAARLAISRRYLGEEGGRRYVEKRTKPGVVVRLPLAAARTWDLSAILPD